jgi:D-sedoheptulose 7-phosphate isomerase
MSTLDRLFTESSSLADFAGRYTDYIARAAHLSGLGRNRPCRTDSGKRSASRPDDLSHRQWRERRPASHFANDLSIGPRKLGTQAYRAISLSDNNTVLTAAGNDLGYDTVFVEQLRTLLDAGDVVIAISASGNSPNILKAVEYANQLGAVTIGFTGFDGGALGSMVSEHVNVATPKGDYGPVEDLHLMLNHLIWPYLVRLTCENSRSELPYVKKRPAIVRAPAVLRADTA